MSDTTTTARLLALWEAVPETRPCGLGYSVNNGDTTLFLSRLQPPPARSVVALTTFNLTDSEAHAIACDSIERWLRTHYGVVEVHSFAPDSTATVQCGYPLGALDHLHPVAGSTKLDALIAAAEAVNARSGK